MGHFFPQQFFFCGLGFYIQETYPKQSLRKHPINSSRRAFLCGGSMQQARADGGGGIARILNDLVRRFFPLDPSRLPALGRTSLFLLVRSWYLGYLFGTWFMFLCVLCSIGQPRLVCVWCKGPISDFCRACAPITGNTMSTCGPIGLIVWTNRLYRVDRQA